jgi:hypothetical protein
VEFTPDGSCAIANTLNTLVQGAAANFENDERKITPFLEGMGSWEEEPGERRYREFRWEREWRHLGDLDFSESSEKVIWLCPEDEIAEFEGIADRGTCG